MTNDKNDTSGAKVAWKCKNMLSSQLFADSKAIIWNYVNCAVTLHSQIARWDCRSGGTEEPYNLL